ncbi:hypothetical protein BU15DRAFT_42421 [Melanogaster broomeanus]|nr:hypothetical protein BU15DRAFT_42421 [Melanogaster broomeanus]
MSPFICSRSIWSIIITCILSLAACTWNAAHFNIPSVKEGRWTVLLHRLYVIAFAVITPELYLVWALQQYTSADMAAETFNKWRQGDPNGWGLHFEEWNRTHGFFAEMGGFQLYVNGHSHCPLTVKELTWYIEHQAVALPEIKEAEILDRNKNDSFNKGLVVIQLLSFAFRFVVRAAYRLPSTLLEVETLALAILSLVSWFLWWKKPKDVALPYRVDWQASEYPQNPTLRYGKPSTLELYS